MHIGRHVARLFYFYDFLDVYKRQVYIQDVLILQLVAVIIDFVFDVERLVDINTLMFRLSLIHI